MLRPAGQRGQLITDSRYGQELEDTFGIIAVDSCDKITFFLKCYLLVVSKICTKNVKTKFFVNFLSLTGAFPVRYA